MAIYPHLVIPSPVAGCHNRPPFSFRIMFRAPEIEEDDLDSDFDEVDLDEDSEDIVDDDTDEEDDDFI